MNEPPPRSHYHDRQRTPLQEIDTTNETVLLQTLTYIQTLKHTIPEPNQTDQPKKYRQAGSLKGMFTMADDFDAPLEDLKDYM